MKNMKKKTTDNNRPSFNEWVKMFKVSSRYVAPAEAPSSYTFNIDQFKENIKNGRVLNNSDL